MLKKPSSIDIVVEQTIVSRLRHTLAASLRVVIPIGLIVAGIMAFLYLSVEPAEEKSEPAKKQLLRTNVTELAVTDYPVVIETNGIVQSHNEVALSSQISGQVTEISPSFQVGSYFAEGEVLVELDARDYETAVAVAEANKLSAESALELAVQAHDRLNTLFVSNNISEAELNQAAATMKQAAAQFDSATAALQRAQRDLERTKIRAPFNGRVRDRTVGLGQSVGQGTPLGIAFAVDFAEVRLPISSDELPFLTLPELSTDPPVPVELRDAVNEASDVVWNASIVRTEGTLNENSLEVFVIAKIDDPFGLTSGNPPLRIGQPVSGTIEGAVLADVVPIPRSAVRQLDVVYLVDGRELTVSSKTIDPLWSDEEFVIVRDPGISNGTLLSTTQLVFVPEGSKVEIIPDIEATVVATDDRIADSSQQSAN